MPNTVVVRLTFVKNALIFTHRARTRWIERNETNDEKSHWQIRDRNSIHSVIVYAIILKLLKPFKILLDASLWNESVTKEFYMVSREIEWPRGKFHTIQVAELKPRILRRKTLEESAEIFEAMRYVAEFAKIGGIQLYDTIELMFEWMGRGGGPSMRNTEFDVLKGVKIVRLKTPIGRAVVFSGFDSEDHFEKQKEEWLESIQEPRFLELKRIINRKHWADAYHLWTAEVNGLDCVLTMETKVRKILGNQKKRISPVEIINPFELAERFRLSVEKLM